MFNNPMVLFFPSDLLKSYIHGHYRLNTKTGKRVWIESYQDKRPERNRAEFANWQHRIEHVKTHLAYGQKASLPFGHVSSRDFSARSQCYAARVSRKRQN